jgi:hypothetical protein
MNNYTALHTAIVNNNYNMTKLLIDAGANTSILTASYQTALELSVSASQNPQIIEYLIDHTEYPLHRAIGYNMNARVFMALVTNYSVEVDLNVSCSKSIANGFFAGTRSIQPDFVRNSHDGKKLCGSTMAH